MSDYIPRPDGDFDMWQKNFVTYAAANAAALGLLPADITLLTTKQTAWTTSLASHVTASNAAKAACEKKDESRDSFEETFRADVRRIQANPAVTDEQRLALGITVKDELHTMTAAKAAATRPLAVIDTSERLRHTIKFYDEATPNRRAKPDGVMGAEIWVKIGDPAPTDGSQCVFVALDTASPYVLDFDGAKANQKAYYMLRWVTTQGAKGPWSETVLATIVG